MGKPFKIERIGDIFWLLRLEHVITEASLMTGSIKLHLMLMNWMCFPLQVWGWVCPPGQIPRVLGGSVPQNKNRQICFYFEFFRKRIHFTI